MIKLIPQVVFAGLLFSLLVTPIRATAAIAPLSPAQLREQAEEIFTGKVLSITESEGQSTRFDDDTKFKDRTFTITMGVISVLKYKSVTVASQVKLQAWQPVGGKNDGLIGFVGPQGHVPIPKKGDIVTVYAAKRGSTKAPNASNKDSKLQIYVPLLPNGMVIQKDQPKQGDPNGTTQPSPAQTNVGGPISTLKTLSNSSSFQFMATIALYKEMLINAWNEKTYRQFSYYHGLNQTALSELSKTHKDDKIWGPWFKEKLSYQASVYAALQPYIAKKRKGEAMTAQDIAALTQINREVTAKLGK